MEITEQQLEKVWEFDFSSLEAFRALCEELKLPVEAIEDTSILAEPVQAGPLLIPNSLAIHPMEGCDSDYLGRPGKLTRRRYQRFAGGGAGLIWAEAIAVRAEARANPRQLWINEDSIDQITDMVSMMRSAAAESMGPDHNPVIVAQLTHSGRYSKPEGKAGPLIPVRDPYRDPLIPQPKPTKDRPSRIPDDWPVITDEYLDELQNDYVTAARLAFQAGFDAVDIKSCHGYLINEILASHTREGKYGGSFENRTRFLLEVIDKIHNELGDDKPVTLRLGVFDCIPYPYGWGVDKKDYTKPDLTEPKKLIKLLRQRNVKMINITVANPYYNPHVGRPFNIPIKDGYEEPEHPLVGVNRMIQLTGTLQKAFPDIAMIGSGYSWLRQLMGNVAAATKTSGLATIIGAGRMAFAYPDFAKDILAKHQLLREKICVSCSGCTQIMRDGGMTGCVIHDNRLYGPIFKEGRRMDPDRLRQMARECRQCQDATCTQACPAHVNIPAFIHEFLEGNDRGAYEIIREKNVLPEICAWLCPVEDQCQGGCLQGYLGDHPLPIADVQRYIAEEANKHGWSKLRMPAETTGKNIAVIGAGPAGLAATAVLIEAGHRVTVYDKNKELGGMIATVIPPARQFQSLKHEVTAIFDDLPEDRLILNLGTELNEDFDLDAIMAEGYDAAFIGIGLPRAVSSGDDIDGLYNAIDFLNIAKTEPQMLKLKGKRVTVMGGGNTAMDVAITAHQNGAKEVYIVYRRSFEEMPATITERNLAIKKGINFMTLTQQLEYIAQDDKLTAVRLCLVDLGIPDESGRRRPEPVEGAAFNLETDIAVEAIGQQALPNMDTILNDVKIENGLIAVKQDSYETSRPKVYAGGDLVHGATTVVAAVADGMAAAREIDKKLKA